MTIKLLSVGKTDNKQLKALIDVYTKRLSHYIKFEFEFIPTPKQAKHLAVAQQKQKEGELILQRLSTSDHVIILDEKGTAVTSLGFSKQLQTYLNAGLKQLVYIIGGPYGFSDNVYQRANTKLALSKMTFSHQMVRLFFVEQLYRGFTILKNEPYHHQ